MAWQTLSMTPALYQYLLNLSLREDEILAKLRQETHKLPQHEMQIAPEQGQFMGLLVKILGAKKTLDIGTFTGYSALSVALALPDDGKIISCDVSEEWTSIAKTFWETAGVLKKIDLKIAPALTTLNKLIDEGQAGTFDFAFIDADKNNYIHYYEAVLALLKPGGLAAIDNVLWEGTVANVNNQDNIVKSIRAFNEHVFHDKRVDISMVPIADGLTLARKRAPF